MLSQTKARDTLIYSFLERMWLSYIFFPFCTCLAQIFPIFLDLINNTVLVVYHLGHLCSNPSPVGLLLMCLRVVLFVNLIKIVAFSFVVRFGRSTYSNAPSVYSSSLIISILIINLINFIPRALSVTHVTPI